MLLASAPSGSLSEEGLSKPELPELLANAGPLLTDSEISCWAADESTILGDQSEPEESFESVELLVSIEAVEGVRFTINLLGMLRKD